MLSRLATPFLKTSAPIKPVSGLQGLSGKVFAVAESDFQANFVNRGAKHGLAVENCLGRNSDLGQKSVKQGGFGFADFAPLTAAVKFGFVCF